MKKLLIPFALAMALVSTVLGQTEANTNCPSISVTGPAGVAQPGDVLHFSVSLEPEVSTQQLRFEWQISQGVIVGPKGARTLKVRPEKYFSKPTTATVKVLGLPIGCPNVGSETHQTVCDSYLVIGDASLWTQYAEVTWTEERKHLDSLTLEGLKHRPGYKIYLEKTFRNEASQQEVNANIRQIKNYLNKVKRLPRSRFFIRTYRSNSGRTTGYLVPPDAPVLDPKYVDVCRFQ